MTVRERMLALRLIEKEEKNPEYAKQIGMHVYMKAVADMDDKKEEKSCLR